MNVNLLEIYGILLKQKFRQNLTFLQTCDLFSANSITGMVGICPGDCLGQYYLFIYLAGCLE
jgi:hypothetical protein